MNLSAILLAFAPPAQPGQEQAPFWTGLIPIVLLIVIFYFLLIRPQQKKAKEHAELVKNVRTGDKVVTNGGVIGVIITVREKSVTLRSSDSKMELAKSAITEVIDRSGDSSDS